MRALHAACVCWCVGAFLATLQETHIHMHACVCMHVCVCVCVCVCVYGIPCDSSRDHLASAEFPDMQHVMANMSPMRGFSPRYGIYAHIANIFFHCVRARAPIYIHMHIHVHVHIHMRVCVCMHIGACDRWGLGLWWRV